MHTPRGASPRGASPRPWRRASRRAVLVLVALSLPLAPALLVAQHARAAGPTREQGAPPPVPLAQPIDSAAPLADARARLVPPASRAPSIEPPRATRPRRDTHGPWWAPVASALVPGTGQAALGQDRWLAYAALEGAAWMRFFADRQEAQREQRGYRRIANRVARALFTTGTPPDGNFEYYETMEKWIASGVYDAVPQGDLQPETDETTYNGSIWRLARETYWSSPDEPPPVGSQAYLSALGFYQNHAIRPEFRWSWRDAQLQQDLYRRAILRSNAASQRATTDLAVVLANHVLSTVDAYITVRLRRRAGPLGGETQIEATLPWP